MMYARNRFGFKILKYNVNIFKFNNNNNSNVYLINRPYWQEPFIGAVHILCNIIITQIFFLIKTL